ncbi:acyl-CoA thioesterase [Tateyamaria omphalii]|uniref:acyl-CoA thioesterase n=1 Tax=Tateyamaria omphalii TaxID=299262 RepID=UPI001C992151|nr:thioesterase family protein [Tateyamaria omphalii]MBY5934594.1 acyl-CoA thioesterase [Tateyamaria omphalii]
MSETFTHDIRVTWGDCDPAKIAYTARLPWFALDAINAWWEAHLGGDGWYQLELDHNIGTPFVHMSMDFRAPVTPRHRLICEVWPSRLGEKSVTFRVDGRQDGTLCFEGTFTCVFVIADQFKSQPAPSVLRDALTPHLRAT